jgi:hypothetical protein
MKINKKIASLAVASALILTGLSAAQSAQADQIAGTITITPTSGNVSDQYFLQSVATSVGAPVGYRAASTSQIFQNGVLVGNISNLRTTSMAVTAGTNGLDGNPAFMDRSVIGSNNFVSNKQLNNAALSTLVSGNFEYRYYFHALSTSLDLVNDKYLSLTLTYNATTGAWGFPAAPAIVTTTSLTAGTTATAGEVALSATVKDSAGTTTQTAAAGNIVFKEGATTVATIAVASGVASTTLTGVADGAHTYTAEFAPSNAVYAASTSASATVNLGATLAPGSKTSNITVAIPTGVGNLYLTSASSSVNLGTAVKSGGTLNASGTLSAVVTDERQIEYPVWNLTGVVGNFTKSGGVVLDGKYLGWTPSVAVNTIGSTAGPVVAPAPGTTSGLKTSSLLATGSPSYNGTVTNASALLLLQAPVNTPAGAYSATLTLTLI